MGIRRGARPMTPWHAEAIVYLVDDDERVRQALSDLLRSAGLAVQAFDSAEALPLSMPARGPACAVLDVRMPGMSGLELQRRIARVRPELAVVFLTGHGDIPMAVHAIKSGAVQFLTKPVHDEDLFTAIRQALRQSSTRLQRLDPSTDDLLKRLASLSPREREVADLVVAGQRNKQVAQLLGISEVTVKVHRQHLMAKMGAATLAELVSAFERLRALDGAQ
jgi:FixJ family two-component response regulator